MEFMIPITMFVCIAAVAIFRPLTKQLGRYLETMANVHANPPRAPEQSQDLARATRLLEHVVQRLDVMEERLDFTERLVSTNQRAIGPRLSVRDTPDIRLREESFESALR